MKAFCRSIFLLLTIISFSGRTVSADPPANVLVVLAHPERFTDFRMQNLGVQETAQVFSDEIARALSPVVASCDPGAKLTLHFTDVDLAGRFEPWRGPHFSHIRFLAENTGPMKLYFNFELSDRSGKIIKSGSKSIVDADLDLIYSVYHASSATAERLFFEKLELRKWTRSMLKQPPVKATGPSLVGTF
jgi:hypothetical protein